MAVAAIITAVTAVVSAVGAISQGEQQAAQARAASQSQANMMEYNSKMNVIQANQANAAAGRQEEQQRAQARQAIGLQLASSAEAGAGLNQDLLRGSLLNMESDTNAIRYEGGLRAQGLQDSALINQSNADATISMGKARASSLRQGSYFTAAGTLLSGAGKAYAQSQGLN